MELIWTRRYSYQGAFLEVSFSGREIDGVDAAVASRILSRSPKADVDWVHEQLMATALAPRLKAVALQKTPKTRVISALSEVRYV